MTFTLSWPLIAAIVATVAVWIWTLRGAGEDGGPYDLGPLLYGLSGVALTLAVYLAYFAARVAFGF